MARVSADLTALDRLLSEQPPAPQPAAPSQPSTTRVYPAVRRARGAVLAAISGRTTTRRRIDTLPPPPAPPKPPQERSEGWIGKLLAVAGVAVTLIGVVLLLVLAAQAGILRPEIRVAARRRAGRGTGGRRGAGCTPARRRAGRRDRAGGDGRRRRLHRRHRRHHDLRMGRPHRSDCCVAAVIGGGGLTLARRWDSSAPRPAGAGAADRAGARSSPTASRCCSSVSCWRCPRRRCPCSSAGTGSGCMPPAIAADRSAAGRAGRGLLRVRATTRGWSAVRAASRPCLPSPAR